MLPHLRSLALQEEIVAEIHLHSPCRERSVLTLSSLMEREGLLSVFRYTSSAPIISFTDLYPCRSR